MNSFNTIIFDAGGVLVYIKETREGIIRRLLSSSGYEDAHIEKALCEISNFDNEYFKINSDIVDWADEKKWWRARCGRIAELVDPISCDLKDKLCILGLDTMQYGLFRETKEVLVRLKDKYELCILSNATATLDWAFDMLDIRKYFKDIMISSYERLEKPDVRIYLNMLDRIEKKPNDCIFVDDKIENITAAESIGIKSFLLNRAEGDNLYTFEKAVERFEH